MIGVIGRYPAHILDSYDMAPVTTLRHVFRVAQRDHQLVEELGRAVQSSARCRENRRDKSSILRHNASHESPSLAPLPTMHTQGDLVQQRGTTGDQQKLPSGAAASSSLRGSFLALRTI